MKLGLRIADLIEEEKALLAQSNINSEELAEKAVEDLSNVIE